MFTNFESLKLEQEMKTLDRQIDKLMAISSNLSSILDSVPYNEDFAYNLLNKEYWKVSDKTKVLFSVQKSIEALIEHNE